MVDIRKGSLNGRGKCAQQCILCIKDICTFTNVHGLRIRELKRGLISRALLNHTNDVCSLNKQHRHDTPGNKDAVPGGRSRAP